MEKYLVSYCDEQEVMNEEELNHFVQKAVINNKDIHNFTVNRLEVIDVDVDDYGQASYIYDFKEYPNANDPKNLLSALAMYALDTDDVNILDMLEHVKRVTKNIDDSDLADHFETLALKIINSRV